MKIIKYINLINYQCYIEIKLEKDKIVKNILCILTINSIKYFIIFLVIILIHIKLVIKN